MNTWKLIKLLAVMTVMVSVSAAWAQPHGPGRDGWGPGPGGGREMGGPPRALTPEQQEQVLAVLREMNPQFAQRLEAGLQENPEMAERVIRRLGPRVMHLVELKQHDPQLYELRVADQQHIFQTMKLTRELREARDAGDQQTVQRLKEEIRKGLEEHFQIRHQLREHELSQLEKRIAQLREELAESRQEREQMIEKQMQRIMEGQPPEGSMGPPPPEGDVPPPRQNDTESE